MTYSIGKIPSCEAKGQNSVHVFAALDKMVFLRNCNTQWPECVPHYQSFLSFAFLFYYYFIFINYEYCFNCLQVVLLVVNSAYLFCCLKFTKTV